MDISPRTPWLGVYREEKPANFFTIQASPPTMHDQLACDHVCVQRQKNQSMSQPIDFNSNLEMAGESWKVLVACEKPLPGAQKGFKKECVGFKMACGSSQCYHAVGQRNCNAARSGVLFPAVSGALEAKVKSMGCFWLWRVVNSSEFFVAKEISLVPCSDKDPPYTHFAYAHSGPECNPPISGGSPAY